MRTMVPAKVYRNLVETVNANMDKMHRYVKLRKKCLGVDELHMYDVYTPMIADAAKRFPMMRRRRRCLRRSHLLVRLRCNSEAAGSVSMR